MGFFIYQSNRKEDTLIARVSPYVFQLQVKQRMTKVDSESVSARIYIIV
ncbi:hypothetical protein VAE130_571542 [Vibrio aestuarianus]|uniref:Uncharacterized protein n=1 Tax=Vibrio aestuarianus TaxID=28171 RepID=A0ABN8TYL8_9VIBR|nr:hypothetical protein VAE055_380895 [Vibrio aestuarianus]CAH8212403.1 hypothetical protein VAE130_571542 [Vibrio aestuarianus]CAH8219991.1 hypothetical protein VAE142_891537 [Vibrio aestuarianus]CAH8227497.1 hypothetical protein VAEKB19_4430051 [Vibrio aestuarianus]CAH8240047.1 hypothetical protein VAE063_950902 [Vibrio aestuarianus]